MNRASSFVGQFVPGEKGDTVKFDLKLAQKLQSLKTAQK